MGAVFLHGNSRDVLKSLPPDFVHCAVTSPPYFGLRRYDGGLEEWDDGWRGQLGNEPSPDLYIQHLTEICREVKRVLRPDGVFWLNIGDSWAAGGGTQVVQTKDASHGLAGYRHKTLGIKPLDMVLIPEQLALALRTDGWYLRSVLIWAKGVSCSDEYNGNPMPESVNGWRWEKCRTKVSGDGSSQSSAVWQDCPGCSKCSPNGGYILRRGSWRPTDSYERILMLTKTGSYYCDREAVLESNAPQSTKWGATNGNKTVSSGGIGSVGSTSALVNKSREQLDKYYTGGRNLRSVLAIPTNGFKGAHFAVYPPRLIEPLIKAATSARGCCPVCGSPWARVIEKGLTAHDGETACKESDEQGNTRRISLLRQASRERGSEYSNTSSTIGWLPTCSCSPANPADPIPCRVLDPFSGAGTTALVCERLGLDSYNIDTSTEYIKLAEARLAEDEQKRIDEQIKALRREAKEREREEKC